ncbi:MAG: excisionase family DNA-binding protein [Dehalococcoidia bacterium]|nr:MAG: excisionase family DNA-binding protein [Dehalococcoidia bacterium]
MKEGPVIEGPVDDFDRSGTLLTMREACQVLHVHANTLRRWSAKGMIRSYRIGVGYQRRYDAGEVAALAFNQMRFVQPAHRQCLQVSRDPAR